MNREQLRKRVRGTPVTLPTAFAVDPTGSYLLAANQDSDSIVTFRIDQETGGLTPTGHSAEVPAPMCLKLVPQV